MCAAFRSILRENRVSNTFFVLVRNSEHGKTADYVIFFGLRHQVHDQSKAVIRHNSRGRKGIEVFTRDKHEAVVRSGNRELALELLEHKEGLDSQSPKNR